MLVNGRPDGRPHSRRVMWRHRLPRVLIPPIPHRCFFRPDFFRNRLFSTQSCSVGNPRRRRAHHAGAAARRRWGREARAAPFHGWRRSPAAEPWRDGEEKAAMDPSVAPPRSGLDPVARSCGQGRISPAARHRAPLRPELPALRLPPSVAMNLGSHRQAGRP
jgi:hypothetical protein